MIGDFGRRDGDVTSLCDINARTTEQKLRESEERLALVSEAVRRGYLRLEHCAEHTLRLSAAHRDLRVRS